MSTDARIADGSFSSHTGFVRSSFIGCVHRCHIGNDNWTDSFAFISQKEVIPNDDSGRQKRVASVWNERQAGWLVIATCILSTNEKDFNFVGSTYKIVNTYTRNNSP